MGLRQLRAQRRLQRRRQHHHPVFATLSLTHHQGTAVEVNVLHAQAQAFQQTHAGAVQQPPEQTVRHVQQSLVLVQLHQQARHFIRRQHHRQAAL